MDAKVGFPSKLSTDELAARLVIVAGVLSFLGLFAYGISMVPA